MECLEIPLNSIDFDDRRFCVTVGPCPASIEASIRQVGLIDPPIVWAQKSGKKVIVCGFRRLSVLRDLKKPSVEVRLIQDGKANEKALFLLSVHQNLCTRGLNPAEKAQVVYRLLRSYSASENELRKIYLPLLSLAQDHREIQRQLRTATLPPEILEFLAVGLIRPETADRLARFNDEESLAVFQPLKTLRMGTNRQKEYLDLLTEIAARENIAPSAVLDLPAIRESLQHGEHNAPQRCALLILALRTRRRPELSATDKRFSFLRNSLNLSSSIHLDHDSYYESPKCSATITFTTAEDLVKLTEELQRISGSPEILEILQLGSSG